MQLFGFKADPSHHVGKTQALRYQIFFFMGGKIDKDSYQYYIIMVIWSDNIS